MIDGVKTRERNNAWVEIWLWNANVTINAAAVIKTITIIIARFIFIGSLPEIK